MPVKEYGKSRSESEIEEFHSKKWFSICKGYEKQNFRSSRFALPFLFAFLMKNKGANGLSSGREKRKKKARQRCIRF